MHILVCVWPFKFNDFNAVHCSLLISEMRQMWNYLSKCDVGLAPYSILFLFRFSGLLSCEEFVFKILLFYYTYNIGSDGPARIHTFAKPLCCAFVANARKMEFRNEFRDVYYYMERRGFLVVGFTSANFMWPWTDKV